MRYRTFAAILTLALCSAAAAEASSTIAIPHVHHTPTLADFVRLQAEPGAHAAGMARVDALVQRAPADGDPVSERTVVYLGHDADAFYAAFICFDANPSQIRGQLTARERIPDDDDTVALQLDTFGDRKHAYTFQVSAAGVQRDGIWSESTGAWDFSFDAVWSADVSRTPTGFVVLITVPFSTLRFADTGEQRWGLFLMREIPRKSELAFWPEFSRRVAGRLPQAATAVGMRNIAPSGAMQVTPYVTGHAATQVDRRSTGTAAAGFDAKWIVRNRYVIDTTVNPDFSQVESDEPQVTVNERFEKLFPEKRPFFMENAGYFETPLRLLFTRRFVDPAVGVRLTGREGPYSIAALAADDRAPGGDPTRPASRAAAFRATRNVGSDGSVGVFLSGREHDGTADRVAAVDLRTTAGRNWIAIVQAATRQRDDAHAADAAGPAYAASLDRTGRSFSFSTTWHDRGKGFGSELGFIPRTDFRSLEQRAGYRFHPATAGLIAWGPDIVINQVWDRQGTRLDSGITSRVSFEWTGPVTLSVYRTAARERLRPSEIERLEAPLDTDADRTGVDLAVTTFQRLAWSASVSGGDGVNLHPATGLPHAAAVIEATATASARPHAALTIDAAYLKRHLRAVASAGRIIDNGIWRVKMTYQLTRDLGARVIVQQAALRRAARFSSMDPYSDLTADLLLTFMTAPGRALFAGASRHAGDASAPTRERATWQVFVKASYAVIR